MRDTGRASIARRVPEQDVLGFDVAVEHAARVGVLDRLPYLAGEPERLADLEAAFPLEALPQGLSFDIRHDEEGDVVHGPRVVEWNDMRMGQRRDEFDLPQKPLGAGGNVGEQHLHRDEAVMTAVAGQVDDRHPAPAQLAVQVDRAGGERFAEPGRDGGRHGWKVACNLRPMSDQPSRFHESNLWSTPIRDLGLTIEGTRLEPLLAEFLEELRRVGLTRLRPSFYLSTEWGVPFETVAIAIPFYLARPELTALHVERTGHLEGFDRTDILRYLRHEMGHVINYAYRLYDDEEWVKQFGSITQRFSEEYRPEPVSRRYVRHLPGWFAQKHPDEDWAETFAVWMTPALDWRAEYGGWPVAAAKLAYCDRTILRLTERDPDVTDTELDEDVTEIEYSLDQYYHDDPTLLGDLPPGLDGALRAIFENLVDGEGKAADGGLVPAATLIRRLEPELLGNVFRWTGHFPERTRALLRYLAERASHLQQGYPAARETTAIVAVTTLVTGLAMNHVQRGSYLP